MRCNEVGELLSALLDGELSSSEEQDLLRHVQVCPVCSKEFRDLQRLEDMMSKVCLPDLPDAAWEEHWSCLYNKLERRMGYLFTGIGITLLLIYGFFELLHTWFLNPDVSLLLKMSMGILGVGLIILCISTIREKLLSRRYDRYKELVR